MFCPKCGQQQYCSCSSCKEKNPDKIYYKWITPNGPIACGKCGLAKPPEWWVHLEWNVYDDDIKDYNEFKFIKQHES